MTSQLIAFAHPQKSFAYVALRFTHKFSPFLNFASLAELLTSKENSNFQLHNDLCPRCIDRTQPELQALEVRVTARTTETT